MIPAGTEAETSPPSPLRWLGRGAKRGFWWTSFIVGPAAAVALIPALALTAFGFGAGRGLGVPAIVRAAIGFYVVFAACGGVIGAVIGLVAAVLGRSRLGQLIAACWEAVNRPMRLFRRSKSASAGGNDAQPGFLRRRWPWLVGTPVLVVLTAAFATGVYLGRLVDRRLADAVAAADRDDPFWRLDDLMSHREQVLDAENSAIVVAEALSRLPENWPDRPSPPAQRPKPPPTEAMIAYSRLTATPDNVRLDDGVAATLRGQLEKYGHAVQILRTVARYARGRHAHELRPTLIDTPLPETFAARTAGRLMAADAAILAHDGDIDGALDSSRAIFGIGRSIGDEPFVVSQLVRIAIAELALQSIRRVLGQGEPSPGALARLQSLVLDKLAQPRLLYELNGQRAMNSELIRRVRDGVVPISALRSAVPLFDPNSPLVSTAPWGKLMFDNQRAVALELANQAIGIARRPATEQPALWIGWDAHVQKKVLGSRFSAVTGTLPLLLYAGLSADGAAHSRLESDLRAAAILLAAERQRRKTGAWPSSIEAIERDVLPTAPIDVYSGQAFRIERRNGQLFVYSIGPNGKDEQGAFDRKTYQKGGPDDFGTSAWDVSLRRKPASDESMGTDPLTRPFWR